MTPRCFRCGGTVLVEPDEDGENIGQCVACSAIQVDATPGDDGVRHAGRADAACQAVGEGGGVSELQTYLGNRALAQLLGVSPSVITRWFQKGGIPPTVLGPRGPLWSPEDAERIKGEWEDFCILFRRFYGPEAKP